MFLKFFILIIVFYSFVSSFDNYFQAIIGTGFTPNVTGLKPNISISTRTSLYDTNIDLSLKVFQRSVNDTFKETVRILKGSTKLNSTDRCITIGINFAASTQYLTIDNRTTGNGGCDAILGRNCSEALRIRLLRVLEDIEDAACGVPASNILSSHPKECFQNNVTLNHIVTVDFLRNGSFGLGNDGQQTDPSVTWASTISYPSIDGYYDRTMKTFIFTYFVGRYYGGGLIDTGIACLSTYNKTAQSLGTIIQFSNSEYFFIYLFPLLIHLIIIDSSFLF